MSDNYRFDDDGGALADPTEPTQAEIDSPALDHFTELMEEGSDGAVESEALKEEARQEQLAELMKPRVDVVRALTIAIGIGMQEGIKQIDGRVLVREAQLALAQVLCNLTDVELATATFDEFFEIQQQNMNVIGTMGDYVLTRTPSVQQLDEADAASERVQ